MLRGNSKVEDLRRGLDLKHEQELGANENQYDSEDDGPESGHETELVEIKDTDEGSKTYEKEQLERDSGTDDEGEGVDYLDDDANI